MLHFGLECGSIAAYYLRTTNISYEKYLKYLEEHNPDFTTTQENILKEATDYTKTRYNIISLALKRLLETHKDFQDLLLLVSLLDSQDIPREFLDEYQDSAVVDNFVHHLKQHSFLVHTPQLPSSVSSFAIHRSIQKMSLLYLINTLKLDRNAPAIHKVVEILEKHVAIALQTDNVVKLKSLLPHCARLLDYGDLLTEVNASIIKGALGSIYVHLGNSSKAQQLLEESRVAFKQYVPQNRTTIAQVCTYLGYVYREAGHYKEAKDCFEEALNIQTSIFPPTHLRVAAALVHLGKGYGSLGNYQEAKTLLERGLAIYEKEDSTENQTRIAWTLTYLSGIYKNLGSYQEAKKLMELSLSLLKQSLPADHPHIARALLQLGRIYGEFGNYQKAKEITEQALRIFKQEENHINAALSLIYLGEYYRQTGDPKRARTLVEESLSIFTIFS